MPKTFEALGVKVVLTNDKMKIEVPIKGLVRGFEQSPNNFDETKIKRGHRQEFAEYIAKALLDSSNAETGDTPVMEMLDKVFEEIFEGDESFVKYPDDED